MHHHPPPPRRPVPRAAGPALLALGLALAQGSALAWPPRAELKGEVFASAYQPQPFEDLTEQHSFNFYDPDYLPPDPRVRQIQRRRAEVQLGNDAHMRAEVEASVGLLRAQVSAAYPSMQELYGRGLASTSATFVDTLLVGGAGLAAGTPVNYRLDLRISGEVLNQLGQNGVHSGTYATASALLRLEDLGSGQQALLDWRSQDQATGLYSVVLNTVVGQELRMTGNLSLVAWAESAGTRRSASADFMNTAVFKLAPSVAGLNTVGVSGHDFAVTAVPEPGSWALMLAGGLTLALRLRGQRPQRCEGAG
jgi:hypothetical protein